MPFLLVDAMLGAKRERPLTVAGPRDLRYRMFMISEALFPGMHVMKPKFELALDRAGARRADPGR